MSNLNNKKILIVRLSSVGDTVHSLPVVNAIKREFPHAEISWLIEKESSFLIEKNPLVEKVFIFDKKYLKKHICSLKTLKTITDLINCLRSEHFDIAIDLQGLFKSGLLTGLSGATRKIGFKNTREFAEFFLNERVDIGNIFDDTEHIIEKNLKIAKYLGIKDLCIGYPLPVTPADTKEQVDSLLSDINPSLPTVVIIPATLWKSKHWLETHWNELLSSFTDKYNVIITGTEKDLPLINRIIHNLDSRLFINLAGKTNLLDLLELFSHVDLVIGVDTGPLHIAVAANKPKIIGIFGPTSPKRTGALGHKNLCTGFECQPCHQKTCHLRGDKYMRCMSYLNPQTVLDQVLEIIGHS